jgi:uncharacterized membrane protein
LALLCGVAVSGKYAGLIVLLFAIYSVVAAHRRRDLATLLLCAIGAFSVINFPVLTMPEVWKSRVDLEVSRWQATGVANRRQVPHGTYFNVFAKHASPFILGLIVVYLAGTIQSETRMKRLPSWFFQGAQASRP